MMAPSLERTRCFSKGFLKIIPTSPAGRWASSCVIDINHLADEETEAWRLETRL